MGEAGTSLAAAKAELRRQVRRRRAARPESLRAAEAVRLRDVVLASPVLHRARAVACYVSLATEPGTGPLRTALAAAGVRVLLPVVPDVSAPLDWAVDDGRLGPGPLGIAQPTGPRLGPAAAGDVDVFLVPALLVDTDGHRLGQGGGYYDATLAVLHERGAGVPVVALVHDDELTDAVRTPVPTGPLDRPVTAVATPSRWVDVPR
ncbi:MAG TPA: 5-formyltetrahydrofolate cyclo-ligase [Actinomycetales bacterium]|nr:5-formyltetrahydrofolate cyclo-ligase [Actinomycetales bacterium]